MRLGGLSVLPVLALVAACSSEIFTPGLTTTTGSIVAISSAACCTASALAAICAQRSSVILAGSIPAALPIAAHPAG